VPASEVGQLGDFSAEENLRVTLDHMLGKPGVLPSTMFSRACCEATICASICSICALPPVWSP